MKTIPQYHQAIKVQGPGQIDVIDQCQVPEITDEQVLVRVVCVAINPVDAKSTDLSPSLGATLGCDFAGDVVAIGPKVRKSLSVGDGVCGCVFGNNPDDLNNGAFGEYVAASGDLVFILPPDISFQVGATLGVGLLTVGLALYHRLKLPMPGTNTQAKQGPFVLVYGGGTATGKLAIQMLCRSGLQPITTCSPRNFETVQRLGAVKAFDYHAASCSNDIRAFTNDCLEYALDCIADTGSMKICYTGLGSKGGRYLSLEPFPLRGHTRRNVKPDWIIAFTMFNKPISWKRPYKMEAKPKDWKFAIKWVGEAQKLLNAGLIVPPKIQEGSGSLSGVLDGVRIVKNGELPGVKLVYQIVA